LGLGGHTEALLGSNPALTVIGFDRDPLALELASERLSKFGERFRGVLATYDQIQSVLDELGISSVEGVLFDLGVSSMQLDSAERGFAYAQDAPLDMRMDQTQGASAADLLSSESEEELARIFRVFGEERYSNPIARAIVRERLLAPITTSAQLNRIVEAVVPKVPGKQTGHPAKRVYQALRIAVNNELSILNDAIPQAIDALAVGGRIVVMSYHSLEDAIVKQAFQSASKSSTPIELPVELPGSGPRLRVITKGVERASEIELSQNPRAASARLRAAEKLEAA
jgi:16S rRNA (cytosine1402-N4)-methyltransferase